MKLCSEHLPTLENANSSMIIVQASDGSSGEESAPNSREMLEDPMTPPSQETLNPSHKVKSTLTLRIITQ